MVTDFLGSLVWRDEHQLLKAERIKCEPCFYKDKHPWLAGPSASAEIPAQWKEHKKLEKNLSDLASCVQPCWCANPIQFFSSITVHTAHAMFPIVHMY